MKFQQVGSKVASSPEINKLLKERYFLKHEKTWDDVAKRVSSILPEIYPYIRDHYFCPSTPTLFNLNTNGERVGTLSSCFTMPIEDSITGIMDSAKDCAIVTKASGGVGYCFDELRGQNEKIKTLNRNSSGPLPFIKIFSSILDGINQSGVRRGAGMAQLSIDHPSILMFIDAKKDPAVHDFDRFNFSVRVPDWFYEKLDNSPDEIMMVKNVVDGQKFALMEDGKSITVKELWDRVVQRGWQSAEPGVFNNSIAFDRCTVTNLSKTVLSNPCLAGETLVAVADGRIHVPIKQLAEEGKDVKVFTINHDGKIVIKPFINIRKTRENARILKVTFDSGMTVKTTEDHKFLSTNGRFIEAKDLKAGDSIKSVIKHKRRLYELRAGSQQANGQDYFFLENNGGLVSEHRMIAADNINRNLKTNEVVHHKDFCSLNNEPQNLKVMSNREHTSLHSTGENNPTFSGFSNEDIIKIIREKAKTTFKNYFTKSMWVELGLPLINTSNYKDKCRLNSFEDYCKLAGVKYVDGHVYDGWMNQLKYLPDINGEMEFSEKDKCFIINKKCEYCGKTFSVDFYRRGATFCSYSCSGKYQDYKPFKFDGAKLSDTYLNHPNVKRRIKNTLKVFELYKNGNFTNFKKECPLANTYIRPNNIFAPSVKFVAENCSSVFCENDLICLAQKEALKLADKKAVSEAVGESFNHKVVSIEFSGNEDVYDGVVEESHVILVGGNSFTNKYGKQSYEYVVVSQCQEFISIESSSCNLGSINLVKFVKDNSFDFESFEKVIRVATNYLNKIIDNNKFPLEKIKEVSLKTRPIGLGFMGLAHAFYLLGLPFTSKEANELLKKIVLSLTLTSLEESVELAKKDGPYESFDLDLFLKVNDRFFHDERGRKLKEGIVDNGIRNHAVTSIAPTGSLSFLLDISSGVEPVYALSYSRKIEKEGKKYEEVFLSDRFFGAYLDTNYPDKKQEILKNVVDNNGSCQKCKILTEEERAIFITAQDMSAKEHLDSLEIVANNISFSVSKCVAKGTKILTDKGIKNIEDLGGASGDDNFGNPINARVKDMNGNWKKITKHYSGGKKPTKIIKFNNGNSIEFADTHKLLTNNGWTEVSSLNVDDFIYCRSSTYETNNVGQLKIDWSTKFNDKTNSNEVNLPIKMSDELSLFLGMIAADGHLTESTGNVGITTADDKVESVFKELCNKIFKAKIVNIQKDKRTKNTRSVFITSRKLCRYLIQLFGGHNCINKTVPKQIINGSVSEKINFINGITLDGFVKGNRLVLYCGYSKELVDSIFYMCCELGLKPNKSKSFVKNGRLSKWAYGISVPHNYFHPIEEHKNKISKSCFDIPVPQKLKEISYKDLDKKYHGSFKTLKYNKYNSIRSNNSLLELVDWDNDLYLLKIVSIENSFNDVYDIEVEDTHSYLIDNVISHNTINLPNSATVEDVSHVYRDAHRRGIIGVTVYRDSCREGILSSTKKEDKSDLITTNAPKRPKSVHGELHHFTVAGIKYYVAVGMYGPKKQVFEVFTGINQEKDELFIPKTLKAGSITKMGSGLYSFVTEDGDEYKLCNGHTDPATESLTRMLSLSLRHGASLHFCIDQLQKSHGAINTFSKILSRTLKKYVGDGSKSSETCSCGGKLIYESGCKKCPECGTSHCG